MQMPTRAREGTTSQHAYFCVGLPAERSHRNAAEKKEKSQLLDPASTPEFGVHTRHQNMVILAFGWRANLHVLSVSGSLSAFGFHIR